MNIPSNFFYVATVGEFTTLVKKQRVDHIIDIMLNSALDSGVSCSESEIKSWKCNFEAILQVLLRSKVANDAIIGFEYKIPVGGRIDCVLFGHGIDSAANMLHIELKQWSNKNVSEHYSGYTFCQDVIVDGGRQTKYTSHPSAQAYEYQNHLLNHVQSFEKDNINLYGFAYCYNYLSEGKKAVLLESTYEHVTSRCPIFCKDQIEEFSQTLNELIGKGDGKDIMNKIACSEITTTKRLQDAARAMFDGNLGNEEFSLIGTQLDAHKVTCHDSSSISPLSYSRSLVSLLS